MYRQSFLFLSKAGKIIYNFHCPVHCEARTAVSDEAISHLAWRLLRGAEASFVSTDERESYASL